MYAYIFMKVITRTHTSSRLRSWPDCTSDHPPPPHLLCLSHTHTHTHTHAYTHLHSHTYTRTHTNTTVLDRLSLTGDFYKIIFLINPIAPECKYKLRTNSVVQDEQYATGRYRVSNIITGDSYECGCSCEYIGVCV